MAIDRFGTETISVRYGECRQKLLGRVFGLGEFYYTDFQYNEVFHLG